MFGGILFVSKIHVYEKIFHFLIFINYFIWFLLAFIK